jgi:hypothetical protein
MAQACCRDASAPLVVLPPSPSLPRPIGTSEALRAGPRWAASSAYQTRAQPPGTATRGRQSRVCPRKRKSRLEPATGKSACRNALGNRLVLANARRSAFGRRQEEGQVRRTWPRFRESAAERDDADLSAMTPLERCTPASAHPHPLPAGCRLPRSTRAAPPAGNDGFRRDGPSHRQGHRGTPRRRDTGPSDPDRRAPRVAREELQRRIAPDGLLPRSPRPVELVNSWICCLRGGSVKRRISPSEGPW